MIRCIMCLLCSQPGLGSMDNPPLSLGVLPMHTAEPWLLAIANTFPASSSLWPPNNPPQWKLESRVLVSTAHFCVLNAQTRAWHTGGSQETFV